jgi:methionyl-tRNA formyltransferase
MKVAVFTSNQPRHCALIRGLATVADKVYAVQEASTVLPGILPDRIYGNSDVMRSYFSRMLAAERKLFGLPAFSPANVQTLSLQSGDLSHLPIEMFQEIFSADVFIVFGASWIRGSLIEALIERRAVNIHMGVSPYYRGSSCNFWALYDGNPDLVGATIHLLTRGLDSGPMLFHALPPRGKFDPFDFGMMAVRAAHEKVIDSIKFGRLLTVQGTQQDRTRYTRSEDFTDAIADEYLHRQMTDAELESKLVAAPRRTAILS